MARLHIRLVDDMIKIDLHLGALPYTTDNSVIIQIDTEIENNGTFYTDSNGLLMMKRHKKPFKPEFMNKYWMNISRGEVFNVTENYCPVTRFIKINDSNSSL